MAAMVGARRALLAARCSPRGALVSPARRVDSPASLPAEMGCLPSLVPHRGAGNLAPERFDGDHDHEWGSRNGGNYRESHARHPTDRLNKQVQANLPSDYSSAGAGRTRGGNGADSVNTHYKRNSEQAHQIGGSYGFPDHREPYTSAKVNNESPAYKSRQSYGSVNGHYGHNPEPYTSAKVNNETSGFSVRQPYGGSAYDRQRPTRDLPSAHQQYNSTQGNNGVSGYDTGHTNHHPNGYDTSRSGYYTQNNQQNYNNGQYGYGPSGQSNQQLTGNDRPFFQQQSVDQRSPGDYPNRSGRTSQYPNPSGLHKEGQNGDFGYHVSQTDQRPYVGSKIDTQRNYPGLPMNVNTNDQGTPHGVHQPNHSGIQYNLSTGNPLNSAPYQGAAYCQNILSEETSGKPKVTVEEMDKLCEDGKVKEALEVLALLQEEGTVVNAPHYFKLIQACGDAAALAEARTIHNQISQSALATDIDVNNLILEMYAKCGSMEDAKNLFNTIGQHNLTSWNTMISGFAQNGLGEEATEFFDRFNKTGDKPDPGMFTHVFYACGILASVDEGMLHFESMQKDFGITPTMEHYAGIVNMLGQSGYIDEAREFVERMPVEPSIDVWENLMNMCRLNGFLELGDRCARIIERLDPSRLNEQSKTGLFPVNASELAKEKERKKANAVETRSKVHEYRAGDRSHPEQHKIYEELRYLAAHMKEAGYVADTRFVLHDVDPETKEEALLAHSERLAVSYGIITSAPRAPIRVIKNLRSCGDCHTAFKIISKLVGRLIVARDAKRFHHFENGVCSCKDYW